jgi:Flp pilus assembly protein TadD
MSNSRAYSARALTVKARLLFCLLILAFAVSAEAQTQQASTGGYEKKTQGIALYKQGDISGAIQMLQEAVKEQKADAEAWFYLGLSLSGKNDIKNARKAYETAVKLKPDFVVARAGLAYVLLLGNKIPEAMREAERAITLDSLNADAHYILGVALLKKGNNEKALSEAEAALKLNPVLARAFLLKSQTLLSLYMEETSPPGIGEKFTDKVRAQYRRATVRLRDAAVSLEQYLKLNQKAADASLWREQLEVLRAFTEIDDKSGSERTIFPFNEVDVKPRVLKRAEPAYPDVARAAGIEGTVVLLRSSPPMDR